MEMVSLKKKAKGILIFTGLPIIITAMLLLCAGDTGAFELVYGVMIIIFGYVASVHDLRANKIPNSLIIGMLVSWVIVITPKLFVDTSPAIKLLIDSALGFVVGGGIFMLVYLISHKGLGGGDVKFMAAAGLYLGFKGIIPAMLYGTILAAIVGIMLIALKRINRKDKIPLAPFLYTGILIAVLFTT